jgi:hypothetical protein
VTVRTVTNRIICLKWRQSQNGTLKKTDCFVTLKEGDVLWTNRIGKNKDYYSERESTYIEPISENREEEGQL